MLCPKPQTFTDKSQAAQNLKHLPTNPQTAQNLKHLPIIPKPQS
ncbi:MAG: hypothetical protein ACKO7R_06630 [Pseudanabaena sp.]